MQNHALVQRASSARPSGLLDTARKIDAEARSHVTGSLRFALGARQWQFGEPAIRRCAASRVDQ